MCKSTQPQDASEPGVAPKEFEVYGSEPHQQPLERQEEQEQHILAADESSGIVVFGSFVAGALVGVIICAPAFMVLLFGAGAALVTRTDSKVMFNSVSAQHENDGHAATCRCSLVIFPVRPARKWW